MVSLGAVGVRVVPRARASASSEAGATPPSARRAARSTPTAAAMEAGSALSFVDSGSWVWYKHADLAWAPCKVVKGGKDLELEVKLAPPRAPPPRARPPDRQAV